MLMLLATLVIFVEAEPVDCTTKKWFECFAEPSCTFELDAGCISSTTKNECNHAWKTRDQCHKTKCKDTDNKERWCQWIDSQNSCGCPEPQTMDACSGSKHLFACATKKCTDGPSAGKRCIWNFNNGPLHACSCPPQESSGSTNCIGKNTPQECDDAKCSWDGDVSKDQKCVWDPSANNGNGECGCPGGPAHRSGDSCSPSCQAQITNPPTNPLSPQGEWQFCNECSDCCSDYCDDNAPKCSETCQQTIAAGVTLSPPEEEAFCKECHGCCPDQCAHHKTTCSQACKDQIEHHHNNPDISNTTGEIQAFCGQCSGCCESDCAGYVKDPTGGSTHDRVLAGDSPRRLSNFIGSCGGFWLGGPSYRSLEAAPRRLGFIGSCGGFWLGSGSRRTEAVPSNLRSTAAEARRLSFIGSCGGFWLGARRLDWVKFVNDVVV